MAAKFRAITAGDNEQDMPASTLPGDTRERRLAPSDYSWVNGSSIIAVLSVSESCTFKSRR
jgi:hypothetical protein